MSDFTSVGFFVVFDRYSYCKLPELSRGGECSGCTFSSLEQEMTELWNCRGLEFQWGEREMQLDGGAMAV